MRFSDDVKARSRELSVAKRIIDGIVIYHFYSVPEGFFFGIFTHFGIFLSVVIILNFQMKKKKNTPGLIWNTIKEKCRRNPAGKDSKTITYSEREAF